MRIITLARKPLRETPTIRGVLTPGCGTVNIQASRLPSGRWPANVLFQHAPECLLRGTKRVLGTSIHGEAVAIRRSGVHSPAGGHQSVGRAQPVRGYSDPDGMETVEDWECDRECPLVSLESQGASPRWFKQF